MSRNMSGNALPQNDPILAVKIVVVVGNTEARRWIRMGFPYLSVLIRFPSLESGPSIEPMPDGGSRLDVGPVIIDHAFKTKKPDGANPSGLMIGTRGRDARAP